MLNVKMRGSFMIFIEDSSNYDIEKLIRATIGEIFYLNTNIYISNFKASTFI